MLPGICRRKGRSGALKLIGSPRGFLETRVRADPPYPVTYTLTTVCASTLLCPDLSQRASFAKAEWSQFFRFFGAQIFAIIQQKGHIKPPSLVLAQVLSRVVYLLTMFAPKADVSVRATGNGVLSAVSVAEINHQRIRTLTTPRCFFPE